MKTFFQVDTTFVDGFEHTYLSNTAWVAILAKNSFDVVQPLCWSAFGADRHSPVH